MGNSNCKNTNHQKKTISFDGGFSLNWQMNVELCPKQVSIFERTCVLSCDEKIMGFDFATMKRCWYTDRFSAILFVLPLQDNRKEDNCKISVMVAQDKINARLNPQLLFCHRGKMARQQCFLASQRPR